MCAPHARWKWNLLATFYALRFPLEDLVSFIRKNQGYMVILEVCSVGCIPCLRIEGKFYKDVLICSHVVIMEREEKKNKIFNAEKG